MGSDVVITAGEPLSSGKCGGPGALFWGDCPKGALSPCEVEPGAGRLPCFADVTSAHRVLFPGETGHLGVLEARAGLGAPDLPFQLCDLGQLTDTL